MTSSLDQLKAMSVVVADTGDFEGIQKYKPQDGTTNPSLLLQACALPAYSHLLADAVAYAKTNSNSEDLISAICDKLAVNFGAEILKIVPGVVSTEVDASASFDKDLIVKKAHNIIKLYNEIGVKKDRVLIKIATTWEGCQAAKVLESDGIHCNMTLMFSKVQAIAAAEANAFLVSPFVGRILDWHKKNNPSAGVSSAEEDPGVISVREIYKHYKSCGYRTLVMGASFRNVDEIIALAGCDRLTISPAFLEQLASSSATIVRCLDPNENTNTVKHIPLAESEFRWMMNRDAMATEKLAEGIRFFDRDLQKLRELIQTKLA